ncbi:hypothetical protein SLS62_002311 [Diatrype stigma]|uniref:Uncharacterized protein n=1 Tax=Diatrype stigma TaxID=117547 RepID=A0AAN9UUQ7_9PEZI
MPPKKTDNGNEGEAAPGFTDREAKMATLALKLLPESAKKSINFEVFVTEFGQKDVKSARECFRQACKKHGWFEGADGTRSPAQATPKKSPVKRQRGRAPDDDDGDFDIEETPTKKRKTASKKAAVKKSEPIVSTDDDDLADFMDGMA